MRLILVPPLSRWAKLADVAMVPLMRLLSGTPFEEPQRTHRWNNVKLTLREVQYLKDSLMITESGVVVSPRWSWWVFPTFHIPLLGGWKKYTVLRPKDEVSEWYIGWIARDVRGVSKIRLRGSVRVLIGPSEVKFFGLDWEGKQLTLRKVGEGRIGDGSRFSQMPLL